MKNAVFFVYLLVVGILVSCKSVDPTLIGPPKPPLYDYSKMDYYGFNEEKDSCFYIYNPETDEVEQYIVEKTRYVVVTADTYYLIRFENR